MTLACLWMPSCLPLGFVGLLHLGGGTRGDFDGGPGPGGGFCCHLVPGAWLVKTLGLGVCAWCGLILGGELVGQFSLCPRC